MAKSLLELLLRYFRANHPLKMLWHLIWFSLMLCALSVTYIFTFHFEPLLDLWQRNRSMEHFRYELSTTLAIDTQITEELQRTLRLNQADRAYVFRYHNGVPAVGGVPFIFHTNTHEVIRPGVSRVISLMQRIPSSINIHMNLEFAQNRCVVMKDLDQDTHGADYWYYQSRSAKHMVRCAFYSPQGDLLGFVGLDYLSTQTEINLQSVEASLKVVAENIGRLVHRR